MTQAHNANGGVIGSKSNDFTLLADVLNIIDGSANTVDGSFPTVINFPQTFSVHNLASSTNEVRILNPNFTVGGRSGNLSPGDNCILRPGDTGIFTATSTTTMESM